VKNHLKLQLSFECYRFHWSFVQG